MENNILVIGNGFDLAHGLDTRYDDFIDWIRKFQNEHSETLWQEDNKRISEIIGSNGFANYFLKYTNAIPGWVDMERLLKNVVEHFGEFFSRYI